MEGNLRIKRKGNLHGKKNKIQMWNLDSFVLSLDGVCNDRLRTSGKRFFLEEMDSDEENSNRKAGEESTAYENNVAAGENPEKQSVVSDAGSEGNTENSALDLPLETPIPQKIFVDVCGAVVNPGVMSWMKEHVFSRLLMQQEDICQRQP